MIVKMVKISIKDGERSNVANGRSCSGTFHVIETDKDGKGKFLENTAFEGVRVGNMLLTHTGGWDFIRCSPISKIIEQTEDVLVVKTRASTYKLIKISDEGEERSDED